MVRDVWAIGSAYDRYMGRWSRAVARDFVGWLDLPPRGRWLDVGCGSGALTRFIAEHASPAAVVAVDRSTGFVAHSRASGAPAVFLVGDAQALPVATGRLDAAVSGLVLNFVPDPARMVAEMARAVRTAGTVALYVWDYAGGVELIGAFWRAAAALDPSAAALDEAARFPGCAPAPLAALLAGAGLTRVEARAIEVPTPFRDFDDYWSPFLGGQGPAPAYAASLPEERRVALRERLRATLPTAPDGSIALAARAWAARGVKR